MSVAATPENIPEPSSAGAALRVVILYEDFAMGCQARQMLESLRAQWGRGHSLALEIWRLDVLSEPDLGRAAARDAVNADLVVVACRRDHEIAELVKAWFDTWTGLRRERAALVLLFDGPETFTPASRLNGAFFAALARRGNMDLFVSPAATTPRSDLLVERLRHGAEDAFLITPSVCQIPTGPLH